MGRKIYDEDLRLNLILNGEGLNNGSKKLVSELGKMEQEMVKMEQQAKVLAASIKNLEKNATANATQLKLEKSQYSQLTQAMKAHELSIESMRKQVGLAGMTVQQLRNHLNALKVQLFNMPGSAGTSMFKKLQAEITETNIRLTTLTTGASRMAQAWARLEQTINKAGTIVGWFAVVIYGLTRIVSGVITRMKDLEDLIGNVRKNTGLLVSEVWDMKEAFDKWDTRTKTDDLLQMAVVAGKLGVEGKENIMDFVDSANKIQIALGDDLNGSVEDTVNSIGKLTNAFRILDEIDTKTGKKFTLGAAMLRTGDVLNQLAKSSAASAGTILEYMTRLAGVSELAKFTVAQIGGLGSVLDALNVPSERGATALQKIMLQLANPKKIQDFAEALNTTAEGYKQMLANDPNTVLTELLIKFVSTKSGLVELTGGLKDFGVKGQYMTAVLGSLAQNLDVLAVQQKIAADAWKEGTSVLNEYNIMNNNFTAEILKQQKIIRAQTDQLDKEAEPAVLAIVTAWAKFIVALKDTSDWIGRNWSMIKALTFAYIALKAPTIWRISNLMVETVWIKASTAAEQVRIFWMKLSILWTRNLSTAQVAAVAQSKVLTIAHIALTQGLKAAIIAVRALNTSMYLFPDIAMVVTIAALAGAFYLLIGRERELTEVEKRHLELKKSIQEDYFKEKANLTVLMDRLKDVNISQKERIELIKKINSEYGEYLPSLLKENSSAGDLAKSYDLVVEALARKITYQKTIDAGAQNRIAYDANEAELIKQEELLKAYKETDEGRRAIENPRSAGAVAFRINQWESQISMLKKTRKALMDEYNQLQSDMTKVAPKQKLYVIGKPVPVEENEETFKQRQAKREADFKLEEVQIKEHYANKAGKQDEMNSKLRQANLNFLNATIKDYEDSLRTEDSAYLSAREKKADILLEGLKQDAKDTKAGNKLSLKDAKEFEQELIDVEKLRIETIANEREKDVATEDERHLQSMFKNRANDKALEYEEIIHNQNLTEINQKYLDKQLADKSLSFMQKRMLLNEFLSKELIDQEQYWVLVDELNHEKETSLTEFKKQYGLLNNDQMVDLEIAELRKGVFWVLLTEEEKEKAIDQIRLKYGRARAKRLKKTLEEELNDIKEGFTKEQQVAFEAGEILIPLFQKIGEGMGDAFASMFDKSQNAFAVFSKNMLLVAIDETKKYIELQYVKMMARNVASMGPVGVVVTLGEIALIEAAFAAAKGLVGKIDTAKPVSQKAEGSYPVLGASDGRYYNAIDGGTPRTGIYSQPTLLNMGSGRSLVGERAPELVVDGNTFRRIQINAPQLLREIYAYAGRSGSVKQMAEGNYPVQSNSAPTIIQSPIRDPELLSAINRLNKHLDKGIKGYFNKYGTNSLSEAQDDIAKFYAKVNKK